MSSAPVLTATLKAKDETSGTLKQVSKGFGDTFKDIAKSAAGFLAADVVKSMFSVGQEAITLGAQAETLKNAFVALKGDVDDSVLSIDTLRDSVDSTVSDIDLFTAANQAMALGLPTEDLNDLFKAARTVGAAMGRDALSAVQDLTTGIGRQSKLILDNLGILVDTNKAYEDYAATLGKTASDLDDTERKTAFMTAAIESLNSKAKTLEGTTSETQTAFQQFGAALTNIKTIIGEALLPAITDMLSMFSEGIEIILSLIDMAKAGDWEGISETVLSVLRSMVSGIGTIIGNIDWSEVFRGLGTFIADLPFLLGQALFGLGMELGRVIDETDWNAVFRGLMDAWSGFIAGLAQRFAENIYNLLPEWVKNLLEGGNIPVPPVAPPPADVIAQHGFSGVVNRPTTFLAGESGPEAVNISPLGGSGGGASIVVNIGNFIGLDEESTKRNLAEALNDYNVTQLSRRAALR